MPNTIHAHPVFNDCVRFPFSFNYERVWIIVKRGKKRGQIVQMSLTFSPKGLSRVKRDRMSQGAASAWHLLKRNTREKADLSPKGSYDWPIRDLIDLINSHNDYMTTSSCSGRISLFVAADDVVESDEIWDEVGAMPQTKGVHWLLVEHGPVQLDNVRTALNTVKNQSSLCYLRCEGFILHIHCKDIDAAKELHALALSSGFRESGITIGNKRVMLAIRTTAYTTELPISIGNSRIFPDDILTIIINQYNTKLLANFHRINRFQNVLKRSWSWPHLVHESSDDKDTLSIQRYGHCVCRIGLNEYTLFGGYGLEDQQGNSSHRIQMVSTVAYNDGQIRVIPSSLNNDSLSISSVHGAVELLSIENIEEVLLLSGGRTNPVNPLPCVQLLSSTVSLEQVGDVPLPRWGHTFVAINQNSFFLFGGRNNNSIFGDGYVAVFTSNGANLIICTWKKLWDNSSLLRPRFFHASVGLSHNIVPEMRGEVVIIHGGIDSLEDTTRTFSDMFMVYPLKNKVYAVDSNTQIPRFGHTLTNITCNTIVLIGGSSFTTSNSNESYVLHLQMDNQPLTVEAISLQCTDMSKAGQIIQSRDLPCNNCRCHHQAIYNNENCLLTVLGGGQQCMAFGYHYCKNLSFRVSVPLTATKISSRSASINKSDLRINIASTNNEGEIDKEQQDAAVIVVHKNVVKAVKCLLEEFHLLDKKYRIGPSDTSRIHSSSSQVVHLNPDITADDNFDYTSISGNLYMAIPVLPRFLTAMRDEISVDLRRKVASIVPESYLLLSRQPMVLCKSLLTNNYTKATSYLDLMYQEIHRKLPSVAVKNNYPKKYEFVGDVIMLPEDSLSPAHWESLYSSASSTRLQFWKGFTECFAGVSRVGRKSKIDSGPKRESKVVLYLPEAQGDNTSAVPGSPSWVTVVENGISFGFDITRVMFCSGNVTERMRMGTVNMVKNDVIVDLYAGIGYYTVPFLVYGGARHVHACEWNPNSTIALENNLVKNKVSSDRYTIYLGDNANTARTLESVANRVCLGLLPSSKKGWELAARVISADGGMLHVHENVNDDNIDQFGTEMLVEFNKLLQSFHKYFNLAIIHTEKVKSYAPHVLHVVYDVKLTRI